MINYELTKIRAIIFDVDGVLSATVIPMDASGEPMRTVNIKCTFTLRAPGRKRHLHGMFIKNQDI